MFTIAVLGCMLGWLAQWQKSLRPGMWSHFLQDAAGGLFHGDTKPAVENKKTANARAAFSCGE
jgi:hypothetical protein